MSVVNVGSYERAGFLETAWFGSILVVISRPIFGGSLTISEVGVSFDINKIGCILAAVMFVNHQLLSV